VALSGGPGRTGGAGPRGPLPLAIARERRSGLPQPWPIACPCSSTMVTQNSLAGCHAPAAARSRTSPGSSAPRPCASPGRSARPSRVSSGKSRFPRTSRRSLPRRLQARHGPGSLREAPSPGSPLLAGPPPWPSASFAPAPGTRESLPAEPGRTSACPASHGIAPAGRIRFALMGKPPPPRTPPHSGQGPRLPRSPAPALPSPEPPLADPEPCGSPSGLG
jgi:hypothetical protein